MHKHNADMEKYANRCFHSLIHLGKREIKAFGDNAHFPITAYGACALSSSDIPLCLDTGIIFIIDSFSTWNKSSVLLALGYA